MGEDRITEGGCMCGAVRYEAVGEPITVGHCHCHSCRGHTGAPVVTVVMFERDRVKFTKGAAAAAIATSIASMAGVAQAKIS